MVKKYIIIGSKRGSKITIIKQELIVWRRQAQQDDNWKKKVTLKSWKIGFVEKDSIIAKNDRRTFETWNSKSLTIRVDVETKIWATKKCRERRTRFIKVEIFVGIKNKASIKRGQIAIITWQFITEKTITSFAKLDDKGERVWNAKT